MKNYKLFILRVSYVFFVIGIFCCFIEVKVSNAALDFKPEYVDNIGWVSYGVDTGDFNGDGFLDFVTGNFLNPTPAYEVYIFYNDGNANFTKTLIGNTDGFQCGFAAGDFDGDGDVDFIVGEQFNDVALFSNENGIFSKRIVDPGGWNVWGLESGDFDGDGDLDFVGVGDLGAGTYLFINDGVANFTKQYIDTQGRANDVAAGDFDKDGNLDFVLGDHESSSFFLYINNGNLNFTKMFISDGDRYLQCAAGDFNNDNFIDFVGGKQSLFMNAGGGNFNLEYLSSWNQNVSGWATGDLDGDGDIDLIHTHTDEGIYIMLNQLQTVLHVDIDIKPGSYPNCLNMNGHGLITVAILGSDSFDAFQVDITTLEFAGLDVRVKGNSIPQCSIEDVSGDFTDPSGAPDGYDDLVCHFIDDPSVWSPDNGTATLTGALLDGTPIEGTDTICIVPKKKQKSK